MAYSETAGNAGLVRTVRSRETGLLVSLYDGGPAGLDTAGGRWQTVCEAHGQIVSHETRRLAEHHLAAPTGWCEVCMGNYEGDIE